MNKKEAKLRISKLQKEIDKLQEIVDKPIDLFKITNYSEVCEALGEEESVESEFKSKKEFRYHQIQKIAKLYNGDNENNYYYPYFRRTGSGLVFLVSCYDDSSYSGQVAYFKDNRTSDYIGKTFTDIYNDLK